MFASRDDLHLTEVSAGVWQLRLPIPWEEGHVNCFLLQEGARVDMVDCLTVPLQVPASAQVVLEGYVEPGERHAEGPFGDHTGFYTPVEQFPVLHVTKMTSQRDPVYHSIVTSKPPQEDGPALRSSRDTPSCVAAQAFSH